MSETQPASPPPPAPRRRVPWGLLLLLPVLGVAIYSTAVVGQRAANLDALAAGFQQARDRYIIGVCPGEPQLATVPAWAAPLGQACAETEPRWGTEEPALEAVAHAALPATSSGSGVMTALGRFIRTFNPIILLEIFVALTVAFFVLLGVRGGETPAETVISRLGGGLRSKWISTAKAAAIVGLVVGAASLVAGTWASELREEKRICRETAVSYGHLLGIDRRCAELRAELESARALREEASLARTKCEVALAETEATMAANASVEKTANELETKMLDEQDRSTRVLLDAIGTTFSGLARQLQAARADTAQLRAEVAKESSLGPLARESTIDRLSKDVATRAAQEAMAKDMATRAAQDAMAKAMAREDTLAAFAAREKARGDEVEAKLRTLDELRERQCLQKGDLGPLESLLRRFGPAAKPAVATAPAGPAVPAAAVTAETGK